MYKTEISIKILQAVIFACACDLEYKTKPIDEVISKLYDLANAKIKG